MHAPASLPDFVIVRHGNSFVAEEPLHRTNAPSHLALKAKGLEVACSMKLARGSYGAIRSSGSVLDLAGWDHRP